MDTTEKSVFATLNAVDISARLKKKGNLSYLTWTWAWSEVKKRYPDATYTIYHNPDGWNYFTDGRTCWVRTGVTINGLEHIEELPVMDFKNNSIPLERVTSKEVNNSIQRSITKAIARHGLGLYVYSGEDLPEFPELTPEQRKKVIDFLNSNKEYATRALAARKITDISQFSDEDLYKIFKKCLS